MADRGFSPDYSESTEIGRIMVSGAITEPKQLITKEYFEANKTVTAVPVFLYQGKDTAANILTKPTTQNHLWIATTAGVDSHGAAVVIGDGVISDGSTWIVIGRMHGVSDHPSLSDRGATDAHPYTAITDVDRVFTDRLGGFLPDGTHRLLLATDNIDNIRKNSTWTLGYYPPLGYLPPDFVRNGGGFIKTIASSTTKGIQILRGNTDVNAGKVWTRTLLTATTVGPWVRTDNGGFTHVQLTQAAYTALATKDPKTIYLIVG